MVKQVIAFMCEKCGTTHPDKKSARICENTHCFKPDTPKKQRFKSPKDFYKDRDNAKSTK